MPTATAQTLGQTGLIALSELALSAGKKQRKKLLIWLSGSTIPHLVVCAHHTLHSPSLPIKKHSLFQPQHWIHILEAKLLNYVGSIGRKSISLLS